MEKEFAFYRMVGKVVVVTFKPVHFDIEVAKKVIADRKEFTNHKWVSGVADIRNMKTVDKEARTYLQSEDAREHLLATALLTESVFSTYIANFFLSVSYRSNKTTPSKLFTDEGEAIKWAASYYKKLA